MNDSADGDRSAALSRDKPDLGREVLKQLLQDRPRLDEQQRAGVVLQVRDQFAALRFTERADLTFGQVEADRVVALRVADDRPMTRFSEAGLAKLAA